MTAAPQQKSKMGMSQASVSKASPARSQTGKMSKRSDMGAVGGLSQQASQPNMGGQVHHY